MRTRQYIILTFLLMRTNAYVNLSLALCLHKLVETYTSESYQARTSYTPHTVGH
jgi:hypothetical protein